MKRRTEYMTALEQASVHRNIKSLATFIKEEMEQWSPMRK